MSIHHPQPSAGLTPISGPMMQVLQSVDDAVQAKRGSRALVEARAHAGRWEAPEAGSPRALFLEAALDLIGTSYVHAGRAGGHDAWSLIRACAERAGCDTALDFERRTVGYGAVTEANARAVLGSYGFREVKPSRAEPGDVMFFVWGDGVHVAVLTEPGGQWLGQIARFDPKRHGTAKMVHAFWGRAVVESWMGDYWDSKVVSAFTLDRGLPPQPAAANDAVEVARAA
jgi:cell wall-associated NlpC family hydrolase